MLLNFWWFWTKVFAWFIGIKYINQQDLQLPWLVTVAFTLRMLNSRNNSLWLRLWFRALSIFLVQGDHWVVAEWQKLYDKNLWCGSMSVQLRGKWAVDFIYYFTSIYLLCDWAWFKELNTDYKWYFTPWGDFSFKLVDVTSIPRFTEVLPGYWEWHKGFLVNPVVELHLNFDFTVWHSRNLTRALFFRHVKHLLYTLGFPAFRITSPFWNVYLRFLHLKIFWLYCGVREYNFWNNRWRGWRSISVPLVRYLLLLTL